MAMFREDLIAQLKRWRAAGNQLVVMMDANENLASGRLSRALRVELGMRDTICLWTGQPGSTTWFLGQDQIDGIYVTDDMNICGGYHHTSVVDIPHKALVGLQLMKIVQPRAWQLQCDTKQVLTAYSYTLWEKYGLHHVQEKIYTCAL